MTAAELLVRLVSGSVPVTVWSADSQSEEPAEIDWQVVLEGGYDLDTWLNQRADIVDAEMAQERRDRAALYTRGAGDLPELPAAYSRSRVQGVLATLGLQPIDTARVLLEPSKVTVTRWHPTAAGRETRTETVRVIA